MSCIQYTVSYGRIQYDMFQKMDARLTHHWLGVRAIRVRLGLGLGHYVIMYKVYEVSSALYRHST
jgi:hypothetical protein